jgi:hypothetical protein
VAVYCHFDRIPDTFSALAANLREMPLFRLSLKAGGAGSF